VGRTLIVDDEADMRLLLRLMIDHENRGLIVVAEASSGEEAISLRPDLDLDVIVLDHRMPGLTGLETARRLLDKEPELPIVLYSAFIDNNVAEEAEQIGVRRCIRKGDTDGLVQALRELTTTS
jgi:CheY-like chemotaxis protein